MKRFNVFARRRAAALILAAAAALFTVAMLFARGMAVRHMVYPLTFGASIGFVLTALAGGAHRHPFGRLMALGLVLCCAGDLIGPYHFVAGAVAFLFAHLAFIAACLTQGIRWKRSLVAAAPTGIAGGLLALWLLPHVPSSETGLVVTYLIVISCMVILAYGARLEGGWTLFAAGATLFYLSDIFVARWKYVSSDSINAFFCYPLYYLACILLALSVAAFSEARQP